jgi:hypothetical protein
MKLLIRILALIFVVPATYYFIYWLPCSLLPLDNHRWIANVLSLACAGAAGWFVWVRTASVSDGAISTTILGAVLFGGIGFTGGFFGPIIFTPGSNQGPLLGIFITGPGGFILGGIAGFIYWTIKGSKRPYNTYKAPVRQ